MHLQWQVRPLLKRAAALAAASALAADAAVHSRHRLPLVAALALSAVLVALAQQTLP